MTDLKKLIEESYARGCADLVLRVISFYTTRDAQRANGETPTGIPSDAAAAFGCATFCAGDSE